MKKLLAFLSALVCLFGLVSCALPGGESSDGVTLRDDLGNTVRLTGDARVVSCYGSFAECWLLAGGSLVGVTSDAVDEGRIEESDGLEIVGSVKEIDLERLIRISPDYVILSADLTAHLGLEAQLKQLGIPYGYFRVDTFADYSFLMERFCAVTGRDDLYAENVTRVGKSIENILGSVPQNTGRSVLLMRAYSSGIKAKTDDNLAGIILKEMGLVNIADEYPSLLEEMSLEHIIRRDPDYIIVLTMGNEESALAFLRENLGSNPAWSGLSAVKNGCFFVLPKELFHYKPNERWDESYAYLAGILYPQLFTKE